MDGEFTAFSSASMVGLHYKRLQVAHWIRLCCIAPYNVELLS